MRIFAALFLCLPLAACNADAPSTEEDRPRDGADSYFPLTAYIRDQYVFHAGQPYTIERILTLNGERDSSIIYALTADWAAIAKPFFAADISPLKYLDRYAFSEYDEVATDAHVLAYDAKELDLPTRRLVVSLNPVNRQMVKNIYVERAERGFWSSREQKLYYDAGRYISIQESVFSRLGPDKEMRAEYRILR